MVLEVLVDRGHWIDDDRGCRIVLFEQPNGHRSREYRDWRERIALAKDQITYLGAVEEWREAFGGFGYDDVLQDCALVSTSVQKDIGPSQGPLESFDHAIGMVAQDGSVGVWQYASLVRDASGESRWEISSLPRDDTQETLLMIVDDWKAPEAWQGHTIVMATAYLYAVTPDDLGPALPIVYIAPNGVTVDTLGGRCKMSWTIGTGRVISMNVDRFGTNNPCRALNTVG